MPGLGRREVVTTQRRLAAPRLKDNLGGIANVRTLARTSKRPFASVLELLDTKSDCPAVVTDAPILVRDVAPPPEREEMQVGVVPPGEGDIDGLGELPQGVIGRTNIR